MQEGGTRPETAEDRAKLPLPRTATRSRNAAVTGDGPTSITSPVRQRLRMLRPYAEPTYWIQGVPASFIEAVFAKQGWFRVDVVEGKPPLFARYRRSCKLHLPRLARIRPFPYATCLSYSCDKKLLYHSMATFGYSGSVPVTYSSLDEWKRAVEALPPSDDLWYVKTADGCHGRGVEVFADLKELQAHCRSLHNEPYVIQKGVSNVHLLNSRKWTIRHHVLITHDLRIWGYKEAVVIVHSGKYAANTTERAVQILHNSKATRFALTVGPAADLAPRIQSQIERISFEVCDVMKHRLYRAVVGGKSDTVFYALLGLDLLVDTDEKVHLLEVNEFPQFDFAGDPPAHQVTLQTFEDFASLTVLPYSPGNPEPPRRGGWTPLERQLDLSEATLDPPPLLTNLEKGRPKAAKLFQHRLRHSTDEPLPPSRPQREDRSQPALPPKSPSKVAPAAAPPVEAVVAAPPVSHDTETQDDDPAVEPPASPPPADDSSSLSSRTEKASHPNPPRTRKAKAPTRQTLRMHQVGVRVGHLTPSAPTLPSAMYRTVPSIPSTVELRGAPTALMRDLPASSSVQGWSDASSGMVKGVQVKSPVREKVQDLGTMRRNMAATFNQSLAELQTSPLDALYARRDGSSIEMVRQMQQAFRECLKRRTDTRHSDTAE